MASSFHLQKAGDNRQFIIVKKILLLLQNLQSLSSQNVQKHFSCKLAC